MTVLKDLGLTGAPADQFARQSYPGMAHFAGTGPDGMTCNRCQHYDYDPIKHSGKMERPCKRYQQLTGKLGKAVPALASACRHFEQKQR